MTIHTEHPFADPAPERDPARRLRGRLAGGVALLTAGSLAEDGSAAGAAGLTVTSLSLALGKPAHVLALVDPEADLTDVLDSTGCGVVAVLEWSHRDLADAFAGVAPAPGGPFRMATWRYSEWGPVLTSASAWAGFRVRETRAVGWSLLVDGEIDDVSLGETADPLLHRRGRYQHDRSTP